MAARLKVFTWSNGLRAFTVAATSRPKALEAWGADQDLFETGLAHEALDDPGREAALASPGAVIQRKLDVDLGDDAGPGARPSRAKARARARAEVRALEERLSALDAERAEALRSVEERKARLAEERERIDADHAVRRDALLDKMKAARDAVA